MKDFDELVALADLLIENLPPHSEVDGHDFGSGEFNISILTDQPTESFRAAERTIGHYHPQQTLKVAYRELGQDDFVTNGLVDGTK